jgi:hypothetical protein
MPYFHSNRVEPARRAYICVVQYLACVGCGRRKFVVSRDAQRPLSDARNPISALTIHKTVFRHRDETPPMVKTKPSSLAATAAKIPRKSNADHAAVATEAPVMTSPELTNGHEGLVTPPRPFSTVTTPIVLNPEDNDRTSTDTACIVYYSGRFSYEPFHYSDEDG